MVPHPTAQPARVLHVAHHCLPHVGGLEAVVGVQTRGLARRGWSVALLSSASGAERPGTRVEDGVRVVRIRAADALERRFGVPFPVFAPSLATTAWREVRHADLVHIHDPLYLSSWIAAAAARLLRRPYVVHRHVGFVHHPSLPVRVVQRLVLATAGRLVLGGAARIVAIDEHVAAGCRRDGVDRTRLRVLGNGVDTTLFRPAEDGERSTLRAELRLPVGRPLVLFVGRFVPKKQFRAVAGAAGDGYAIVFAGGERPADLPDPRLRFLGSLPHDEVARVMRAVDLCVVASVGECPLTVLEAMSSGVPLLLNDDPALRSSPWTAAAPVEYADVAGGALPERLAALTTDLGRLRARGRAGRAAVERAFSWGRLLDELERIYAEALDAHRGSA